MTFWKCCHVLKLHEYVHYVITIQGRTQQFKTSPVPLRTHIMLKAVLFQLVPQLFQRGSTGNNVSDECVIVPLDLSLVNVGEKRLEKLKSFKLSEIKVASSSHSQFIFT